MSAAGLLSRPNGPHKVVFNGVRRAMRSSLLPLLILLFWTAAAAYGWLPRSLLPSPSDVAGRAWELWLNGDLARHVLSSLLRLVIGIVSGGGLGVLFGLLVGVSKTSEDFLSSTLRFLTPVPVLAWMPIVIVFFGVEEAAKIMLLAIGAFFLMYSTTAAAVRSVDHRYIEVARLHRKSLGQMTFRVVLPASLPAMFEGLRGAIALSWVVLVAAEIVAGKDGLGWLLWDARTFGRTSDAYVAMFLVGLLGFISDILVKGLRNWIVNWRRDFGGF